MALTLLSRMIVTILATDATAIRAGFLDVVYEHALGELRHPTDYMAAAEVCRSLVNDVAIMPEELCELTAMPAGSTYARGADAWITAAVRPPACVSGQGRHRHMRSALLRLGWLAER